MRDAELTPRLVELWKDNYEVYGSRKLWKAARRAGIDIGRDQTARLMRVDGIPGARRTKRVRNTRRDDDPAGRRISSSAGSPRPIRIGCGRST